MYAIGAIAVVGPHDVWAVSGTGLRTEAGGYGYSGGISFVHWNGTAWTAFGAAGGVAAMAVKPPGEVWAVGATAAGPLVERWDGHTWQPIDVRSPTLAGASPGLESVSVAPTGAVVGFASDAPANSAASSTTTTGPDLAHNYLWIQC